MEDLTTVQAVSLSSLSSLLKTVDSLLSAGVSSLEVAEKVLTFVDPAAVPALDALIKVLQEAKALADKFGG